MLTNQYDQIEIWNLKSKVREKVIAIESSWNAITVSYEPGFIYYQFTEGTITKYDPYSKQVVEEFSGAHTQAIAYVLVNKRGTRLVTVGWDGIFNYWDAEEKKVLFSCDNQGTRFHIACMSHDEKFAFCGDYNSIVHIYDLVNQKELHTFNPDIESMPYDLCCTPDN